MFTQDPSEIPTLNKLIAVRQLLGHEPDLSGLDNPADFFYETVQGLRELINQSKDEIREQRKS